MSSTIPRSTSTVTVRAINAGKITFLPASLFFEPVLPGYEGLLGPVYTFLIEHPTKGKIMYDLGMRKDQEKYAPAVQGFFDLFRELGGYDMGADEGETVSEQLMKGGVELGSVNAVIWSHTHFDHIGIPSSIISGKFDNYFCTGDISVAGMERSVGGILRRRSIAWREIDRRPRNIIYAYVR
ncbi:hypothetical protein F5146DRAFT_1117740 [Armillaria mellea]|nr:hypothetical protein F5146DRAFT_1117740 [Armillaria mellea]